MRILISDHLEQACIDILEREGFEVHNRPGLQPDTLAGMIGEYDALIVRSQTKVTAELLARAGALKVVGRAGTGVDNIDVPAATRHGVLVMNTPGGNTISAAEHAISLLLSLARNIPQADASLRRGEWERKRYTGTEVFEKTVGVVGLGKIGREVAVRCQGLGMRVVGYDPVLSPEAAAKLGIELLTLDALYLRADFLTLHTPLTPETRRMLNDTTLARCKKGVRIVNCARGGIVDEGALLRALDAGHVAGAALDVFETEPPTGNPLLAHARVVATPHLGASTEEAQEKVAVQIAHSIADALLGRAYAGVVNGGALHLTLNAEVRPFVVLAERLGSLLAQITLGKVRRLTVGATGELTTANLELLRAGVLKGALGWLVPEPVNIISAPAVAAEVGLTVVEEREATESRRMELLRVRYETDQETREATGTVFGTGAIRLIGIDGFRCEANPEGDLLLYYNVDRPGMLAQVGTVLAAHNVNIGSIALARGEAGSRAITIMNIDGPIPEAARQGLLALKGVEGVRIVHLA
jgi:D-3-phosphoglycerate dehydrogenase